MEDAYFTISKPSHYENKVKGSRFIGECALVDSTAAAHASLEAIRKREHAATHHCYAWVVGLFDDTEFKYSDDGEPSGTAGRPIYDTITGRDLTNSLVVVTRYFGGTKLGTGGLVRAYSETAIGALEEAGRREHFLTDCFEVRLDFPLYDLVTKALHRHEARQLDAEFTDSIRLILEVRRSRAEALRHDITQISAGKAHIAAVNR